jgi:hypothetical protein
MPEGYTASRENFRSVRAVVPPRLPFAVSLLPWPAFARNRSAILADRLPRRFVEQCKEMSGGELQHSSGRVSNAPPFRVLPG